VFLRRKRGVSVQKARANAQKVYDRGVERAGGISKKEEEDMSGEERYL
jgi:hypothetical protein